MPAPKPSPGRPLPQTPTIEALKKEAKDLLKARRRDDSNWSQTLPMSLRCTSTLYYPATQGWGLVGFRCCRGAGEGLEPAGADAPPEVPAGPSETPAAGAGGGGGGPE